MFTAVVCVLLFFPIVLGSLRLAARLVGCTLRFVLGVVLLPVWLVIMAVCGLAVAFHVLLPFALIALAISLFAPEN